MAKIPKFVFGKVKLDTHNHTKYVTSKANGRTKSFKKKPSYISFNRLIHKITKNVLEA